MYYSPRKVFIYFRKHGIDDVCIVPRSFTIDQDTISTISQNEDGTTYVAVPNPDQVEKNQMLKKLNGYELIPIHTISFVRILSRCGIILFKDHGVVYHYRILGRSEKTFVRIPHGLPAKGSYKGRDTCSLSDFVNLVDRNFVKSATTDHVINYMAAECGSHPGLFRKYGFPRFDRVRNLAENPNDVLLPDNVEEVLTKPQGHYNSLYAPTHKDGEYETTLFPFPDRDLDQIYDFLDQHNIRIFIRLHVSEEGKHIEDECVDGENILYAGNNFFGSASEMMPYFDLLVTDFSSIYLDYVLYDRPMIFVHDDFDRYTQNRDFPALDYEKHWPGPKIKTQDEFLQAIQANLIDNKDKYEYWREFVRDVLHSDGDSTFLEKIKESQCNS